MKGWFLGGLIGAIIGIFIYFINIGTSYCVKGLNLMNFFCSVSATFNEFGIIATILSIPKLFLKNIFKISGMGEAAILPLMIISGFLFGGGIIYLIRNKKKG